MKLRGPMGEVAHAEDHGHAALPDSRKEMQTALNGRAGMEGRASRGQSTDNGLTWTREADMVLMACIPRHPLFSRATGMAPRGMSPTSPARKSDAASCWGLHSCASAKQPEQPNLARAPLGRQGTVIPLMVSGFWQKSALTELVSRLEHFGGGLGDDITGMEGWRSQKGAGEGIGGDSLGHSSRAANQDIRRGWTLRLSTAKAASGSQEKKGPGCLMEEHCGLCQKTPGCGHHPGDRRPELKIGGLQARDSPALVHDGSRRCPGWGGRSRISGQETCCLMSNGGGRLRVLRRIGDEARASRSACMDLTDDPWHGDG